MTTTRRGAARIANGAMRGLLVGVFAFGLARHNASIVVNAAGGLAVTFLPALLERDYRISLAPRYVLPITAAALLHAVGMVGLYDSVGWWDHLTHTLSTAVVAAAGYAVVRALDVHRADLYFPAWFTFALMLLTTLCLGVFWEVMEFAARGVARALDQEPVLVQYGLGDTLVDLVFDAVGALLVALFGTRSLTSVVDALVDRLSDA